MGHPLLSDNDVWSGPDHRAPSSWMRRPLLASAQELGGQRDSAFQDPPYHTENVLDQGLRNRAPSRERPPSASRGDRRPVPVPDIPPGRAPRSIWSRSPAKGPSRATAMDTSRPVLSVAVADITATISGPTGVIRITGAPELPWFTLHDSIRTAAWLSRTRHPSSIEAIASRSAP